MWVGKGDCSFHEIMTVLMKLFIVRFHWFTRLHMGDAVGLFVILCFFHLVDLPLYTCLAIS